MRWLPLAVGLAVVLAGCSDGSGAAAGGATATGAPAGPAPAGDQAGLPPADAPAAERDDTATTPIHIEGSTAVGACAVVQCHYEMTDTAFTTLEPAGGLRLSGTLTWDAVSPTSEELTLYVPTLVDGESHWEPGYPSASGPSPLAFDLDLAGLGGVSLGLIVGNGVATGVPGGVVAVQTPQAFTLDATYVHLVS